MSSPRKDRIVQLQEPVTARDNFGGEVVTWTTRAEVWSSFENLAKNRERYVRDSSKTAVIRTGKFGIVRPNVLFDELWRIVEQDGLSRVWDVVGIGKGSPGADWQVTVKA